MGAVLSPSTFNSNWPAVSRPYSRYDVRGTYERGPVQYTGYATFQPTEFSSEPISVIAAGLFYDPRPRTEAGLTIRYRY